MVNCDEASTEASILGNKWLLHLTIVAVMMATEDSSLGWILLGTWEHLEKENDKLRCLNSQL